MKYQPAKRVKDKGRQFDMKAYSIALKAGILSSINQPLYMYLKSRHRQPVQDVPDFTFDDVEEIKF